jgi:hypothetical protein
MILSVLRKACCSVFVCMVYRSFFFCSCAEAEGDVSRSAPAALVFCVPTYLVNVHSVW